MCVVLTYTRVEGKRWPRVKHSTVCLKWRLLICTAKQLCTRTSTRLILYMWLYMYIVFFLSPVCPDGWFTFRKSCYMIFQETITNVIDSITRCNAVNAHQTTILDIKEHRFLTGKFLIDFTCTWFHMTDNQ